MQKAHVSQKIVLYFKGVTVNSKDYGQRSRSLNLRDKRHKQFSTPQKEKPTRKKKGKEKARSSVGRSSEKSHNTNTNFHSGKLQSPQRITKSLFTYQKITISKVVLHIYKKITISKVILHIGQHPVKAETTRKRKRRKRRKRKRK